jgi:hypothetical protein
MGAWLWISLARRRKRILRLAESQNELLQPSRSADKSPFMPAFAGCAAVEALN